MSIEQVKEDAQSLIRHVNRQMIVKELQGVLKSVRQPTSGLKAPLQKRLTNYIEELCAKGDAQGLRKLRALVFSNQSGNESINRIGSATPIAHRDPSTIPYGSAYAGHSSSHQPRILFRESPFFVVKTALSSIERCPVMATNRHTVKTIVKLTAAQVQQLSSDDTHRCMLYCAALDQITGFTRDTDVAFPQQVELRVNDVQISGVNLRGLKNKPGSTRPADITKHLKLIADYRNEVTLTYALTQKIFSFVVNFVKCESVENLVSSMKTGKSISKESVIAEMAKKNEDSDLVATSTIMSLKCPLSTLRITLPVRSSFCTHVQCFDATSFLQLQQQAPTWTCPTCNKSIAYNSLVVDNYFNDILNETPNTVSSVTIDPFGRWSTAAETTNSPVPDSSEDETEIVEIRDTETKREFGIAPMTPASSTARDRSLSANRPNISNKRPSAAVIDLTLDDDDAEPSQPASKRVCVLPRSSNMTPSERILDSSNFVQTPYATPDPVTLKRV